MKKYYDKLTGYGKWMYNLCWNGAMFLSKHRWLYYLLSCTWGIIMTVIGVIITIALLLASFCLVLAGYDFRFIPEQYYWIYKFELGKSWGGMEMGLMFLRDTTSINSVDKHEFGHTFQNCLLGPLFPFLVAIPSATRYWIQEIRHRKGKGHLNKPYDSIWFELSATDIGTEITNRLSK